MQDKPEYKQTSNHLLIIFINMPVPVGAYQFQLLMKPFLNPLLKEQKQKINVKRAALAPPAGSEILLPEQMANKWRSVCKMSNPFGDGHAYLMCHI